MGHGRLIKVTTVSPQQGPTETIYVVGLESSFLAVKMVVAKYPENTEIEDTGRASHDLLTLLGVAEGECKQV